MVLALAIIFPAAVYSGGRSQRIKTQTADGIGVWQSEFDVSNYKPGTYNYIVNAKDAAGNIGTSGPYNIRIDPMAGLPEVHIVYPEEGMVIRNDFNIVGVVQARYGIKEVLIKIDNGEFMPIEGKEYWNLPIKTTKTEEGEHTVIPEGVHTIYVKAVDEYGNTGRVTKITFIIDVTPPVFEILNHEIGDLIAGTVKIKGTVFDSLGIVSLQISTDGINFTPLKHKAKRRDPARHFQFTIPTKKHRDGFWTNKLRT
jgi:hypothetical protein